MYFSDVWFFDTDNQFMYLYSEVMCLLLLRYIKADRKIDFLKLASDLSATSQKGSDPGAFVMLREKLDDCVVTLKKMVDQTSFQLTKRVHPAAHVKTLVVNNLRDLKIAIDDTSYTYHSEFWNGLMRCVNSLSTDGEKFRKYLEKVKIDIFSSLIDNIAVEDLRAHIFEEMSKKNLAE